MVHLLKIQPKFFQEVKAKLKTFEIRKNDRDFKINDVVILQEFINNKFTNEVLIIRIKYILLNAEKLGLAKGFCIFSFDLIESNKN